MHKVLVQSLCSYELDEEPSQPDDLLLTQPTLKQLASRAYGSTVVL